MCCSDSFALFSLAHATKMFRQLSKLVPGLAPLPPVSIGKLPVSRSLVQTTRPISKSSLPNLNGLLTIISRMSTDAQETKRFKEDNGTRQLTIGTHDGIFHCDEVLACFMLQQLPKYANATVTRTRNGTLLEQCDIVVDVGAVFDRENNRFDHHQASFNDTLNSLRPEIKVKREIRLSSAGLIYTYFGEDVIRQILKANGIENANDEMVRGVYRKLYDTLIAEIDAIDNGVPMFDGEPKYTINTHLSARVSHFNPAWNEDSGDETDAMKRFEKAKHYVGQEFIDKVLYYALRWWPARELVESAVKKRMEVHASGEILELEHFCPWKDHLYELEEQYDVVGVPKYVIYFNKENDWRVICVPLQPASFVCRKFMAAPWRGVRDKELETVSGIEGASFCHQTGFIGGNKTREGALRMAVESLQAQE